MPIKIYKPTTPGRRQMSVRDFKAIVTKGRPEKKLTRILKSTGGRNNQGKITTWDRGGGHKKRYRIIDFKQIDKLNIPGIVKAIEYDPNRNCYIALVFYRDGEKRYHLSPEKLSVGDTIMTSPKGKVKVGNRMQLKHVPPGFPLHNLEIFPNRGGQLIRSAGGSATIISIEGSRALLQLSSGETRLFSSDCYATIGKISNEEFATMSIGKAGRNRWLGKRPHVRGKARNPIDHPHGGGEGNQPIGLKHPKTPWGMPALGFKTRNRKKYSKIWIVRSRKAKVS